MSQISNLTIATQTFVASQPQVGSTPARWYEKTAGQLNGYKKLEQITTVNASTGVTKTRSTLYVPVLDAEGVVSHYNTAVLTVNTSHSSSLAEKQDMADLVESFTANNVFRDSVTADETVY